MPVYSFERFDLKFKSSSAASGFNFRQVAYFRQIVKGIWNLFSLTHTNTKTNRYADKYQLDGALHRRLVKAYGLRIFIEVNGRAGRFDIIPLFLSVGSGSFIFFFFAFRFETIFVWIKLVNINYKKGIGLLAIPTLIADFLLFSFAKKRHLYRRIVEQDADEEYEQRQYQQAEVIIS